MADVTIKPIRRLLVANRGEIARRIFRSARDRGISTVAIYADGDVEAPFVKEADMAIALNGENATETYLDIEKVIAACKRSGADAVHPGYGFLSENTAFCQAVVDAGITWVGPGPEVIAQMGDKLAAKKLMQEADVPTLPALELNEGADLAAAAKEIGYPVLVKASAGGGGRGMRIVEQESDLHDAVAGARREAGASFGDDTIFLERWLTSSRHVEIQILGDNHGNLVHCFERECSIQRRHQKVIEEAPSPAVTPEIRARMGEAAVAAAKKLGYASAGTVEFLLSGDEFWFLEVNTRLQVEHPITEEITGLDLVSEQLRLAEGEALGYGQDDLSINGHAIEARLYAENPAKNFLPSPGTVVYWEPSKIGGARFDSGVESGTEVSSRFDPMIAKVVVHAPTRREAAGRLARVLETTRVQGLTTNRDFLVAALRTPEYLAGETTTDFIERVNPDRVRPLTDVDKAVGCIAAVVENRRRLQAEARVLGHIQAGWRNSHMPPERVSFRIAKEETAVEYSVKRDGRINFRVGEADYSVVVINAHEGQLDLEIDGARLAFTVDRQGEDWFVHGPDGDIELTELPRFPTADLEASGGGLVAPMPGAVLATHVAAGDDVKKGQILLILEAMKMEHKITAPRAGKVAEVHVAVGDQVPNGAMLVVLEEEGAA
ncbi:MAG: hypothetical protein CMQ24_16555 [Gammaproteobacteria bacterium]|nr:hypothetical protein [Gammaproteobacteria bacterium]